MSGEAKSSLDVFLNHNAQDKPRVRAPANAGRRFIPLLLADCALPDTLRRYMVVDFCEESEAALVEVLATGHAGRDRVAPCAP